MNVKYNKKKSLKFILNYSVMFSVISKRCDASFEKWILIVRFLFCPNHEIALHQWINLKHEPETSRSSFMCTSR